LAHAIQSQAKNAKETDEKSAAAAKYVEDYVENQCGGVVPTENSSTYKLGLADWASYEIGRICYKIEVTSSKFMTIRCNRGAYSNVPTLIRHVRVMEQALKKEMAQELNDLKTWLERMDTGNNGKLHYMITTWAKATNIDELDADTLLNGHFPWTVYAGDLPARLFNLKKCYSQLLRAEEEVMLLTAEICFGHFTACKRVFLIQQYVQYLKSADRSVEAEVLEHNVEYLPYWQRLKEDFGAVMEMKRPPSFNESDLLTDVHDYLQMTEYYVEEDGNE
jgi:hypothetical protein